MCKNIIFLWSSLKLEWFLVYEPFLLLERNLEGSLSLCLSDLWTVAYFISFST